MNIKVNIILRHRGGWNTLKTYMLKNDILKSLKNIFHLKIQ